MPQAFTIDPAAISAAKACGLGGDVEQRLSRMARRAAVVTHPHGNRRFDGYVLKIQGDRVMGIRHFE